MKLLIWLADRVSPDQFAAIMVLVSWVICSAIVLASYEYYRFIHAI